MRAAAVLVVVAGCGRLGFGGSDDPRDGAVGDGRGDGAGSDGDVPVCPSTFQICDTFEDGIDTAIWSADAMVTHDTTRAHRGSGSVRVHTPAFAANTNSYHTLFQSETTTANPSTFYLRGWFWLSALPAAGNGLELMTAERPSSAGDYVFVLSDRTSVYSQFDQQVQSTPSVVPVGSWFCIAWKVTRSATATGSLEITGDVGTVTLPNVVTDSASAPITMVTFGVGFAASNTPSAQPAFDLWIDDVIADDGPISCTD